MQTVSGKPVTPQHILVFFTGTEREPPLGFPKQPELHFLHHGVLATASTCDLILRLPMNFHNDCNRFKESHWYPVKDMVLLELLVTMLLLYIAYHVLEDTKYTVWTYKSILSSSLKASGFTCETSSSTISLEMGETVVGTTTAL